MSAAKAKSALLQALHKPCAELRGQPCLAATQGMFEISRHPQYTSFPLLFAAIALLSDSVWVYVAGLATFLYLHIGLIPVEEAVLRAAHDWMHEEYVRTVPMYTHCEWLLSTSWPAFVLWCSRLSRCLRRRRRAE